MKNIIGKITLKDVVELKLQYLKRLTQNTKDELYEYNCGKLDYYKKIYIDISEMDERDFLTKYCKKAIKFSKKMDNENPKYSQRIEFQAGANNAIIEFLSIINPEFEYFENVDELARNNNV